MQFLRKVPYRAHEELVPASLETALGLAAEPSEILFLDYTRIETVPRAAKLIMQYASGAVVPLRFSGKLKDGRDALDCGDFVFAHLCRLFPDAIVLYRKHGFRKMETAHPASDFLKEKIPA